MTRRSARSFIPISTAASRSPRSPLSTGRAAPAPPCSPPAGAGGPAPPPKPPSGRPRRYLADTLLRDADAMAMAWSLEVRPVLLDHKLAEFAFGLPASLKLGKINKPVLVDAVRDLLPPELLSRKKTGFELPLQSWLIGPLRERALDAFASEAARTLFARPYLVETTAMLRERRRPPLRTWAYLVLVEWVRAFGVTP